MKLTVVTGLSGSGKSVALQTLEDEGYYCIDNLPLFLLPALAQELAERNNGDLRLTAVDIDARSPSITSESITQLIHSLGNLGVECEIIFLEAQEETLIRRYSETRRKHPLSDDDHPLEEAIRRERKLLAPFQSVADLRIDTSQSTVQQLRHAIRTRVSGRTAGELSLLFQSFGFKHGVPRDADFVYDVRCLPNPYWEPELRPLTGRDPAVAEFLTASPAVIRMRQSIILFLQDWIPCFRSEGRSYLTVAVGCTGGQHRSVFIAEQLAEHFRQGNPLTLVRHREL